MKKFWYSESQSKWSEYVDKNPICGTAARPSHGRTYAVIDGVLVEYTECYGGDNEDYSPNYDDVVFLGRGEYACNDWNIQTYLKRHPEVKLKTDEWPEFIVA